MSSKAKFRQKLGVDADNRQPSSTEQSATDLQETRFHLPEGYIVVYAVFKASIQNVDCARHVLFRHNLNCKLLECYLPYPQILKNEAKLWVFAFCDSRDAADKREMELKVMHFNGLEFLSTKSFTYRDVYDCTTTCSHSKDKDTEAMHTSLGSSPSVNESNESPLNFTQMEYNTTNSSPVFHMSTPFSTEMLHTTSCVFPRDIRRLPYTFLLAALKEHIVGRLCKDNADNFIKFIDGILFKVSSKSQIWCSTWNQLSRPSFVHCTISLRLCPTSLHIIPRFYPTELSPLNQTVTYPTGVPLVLLPHGIPAYFISRYTGHVAQLSKQFDDILESNSIATSANFDVDVDSASFINVWLAVRTPEGVDRGLSVVWPSKFCSSIHQWSSGSYGYSRQRLLSLDRRLAPLAPVSSPLDSLFSPSEALSTATRPNFPMSTNSNPEGQREESRFRLPFTSVESACHRVYDDAFNAVASDASRIREDADFRNVAVSVGSYVDSVAKERERERERLRRERDASSSQSPKLYNTTIPSGSSLNIPIDQHSADGLSSFDLNLANASSPPILSALTEPFSMFHISGTVLHTPQQATIGHDTHHPYPSPPDDGVSSFGRGFMQPFPATGLHPTSASEYMLTPASSSGITYQSLANVQAGQTFDVTDFTNTWTNSQSFMMDLEGDIGTKGQASAIGDKVNEMSQAVDEFASLFGDDDDPFSFFDQPSANNHHQANSQILDPLDAQALAQAVAEHLDTTRIAALIGETSVHDSPMQGLTPWLEQMAQTSPNQHVGGRSLDVPVPALTMSPDISPTDQHLLVTPSGDDITSPQVFNVDDFKEESMFRAISFSSRHLVANEKYTSGKFMTQPDIKAMPPKSGNASTRDVYSKKTNPRHGIVEKLTKRKAFTPSHSRLTSVSDECLQSVEVDPDDQDSIDETWSDDDETKVSRPASPETPNFGIGSLLLASCFNYSLLLQLSASISSPETALSTPAFASPITNIAPTPISPGFTTNTLDDDRLRWQDGETRVAIREVMSNPLWAFAMTQQSSQEDEVPRMHSAYYQHITQSIVATLGQLAGTTFLTTKPDEIPMTSEELHLPQISVSKCNSLIDVNLSALRFWDKMGLGPRSGTKDVIAFLLHEDDRYVRNHGPTWLRVISEHYRRRGYGTHRCGHDESSTNGGLVSVQFDQLQTVISAILLKCAATVPAIVFYIVIPPSDLSPRSTRQLQLMRTIAGISQSYHRTSVTFHLVARTHISSSVGDESAFQKRFVEVTVDSVYDRIPRCVCSAGNNRLQSTESNFAFFQAPVFTISRVGKKHVSFAYQYPPPDVGVLDETTALHVGYRVSQCYKYVIASVVDERGEEQDVSTWFISCDRDAIWQQIVGHIWSFALRAASRAKVDWTLVVAKLGGLEELELNAWLKQLDPDSCDWGQLTQVSLVAVECDQALTPEAQWNGIRKSVGASPRSKAFIDALPTMRALLVSPIFRTQASVCRDQELFARSAVIEVEFTPVSGMELLKPLISSTLQFADSQTNANIDALYVHLFHTVKAKRSTCTTTLAEVQTCICRNFYDLAVLAHSRSFMYKSSSLPIHLAVLQLIEFSLRLDQLS